MEDYEQTYKEFWKGIIINPDGSLNADQIKRELHDYYNLMRGVEKVYCEITCSHISKCNTAPENVIAAVDQRIEDAVNEARQEWYENEKR